MSDGLMNGRELPEGWRVVRLDDMTREYISGGTPSTKEPQYWDGDIAWTTSAPISEDAVMLNHAPETFAEMGVQGPYPVCERVCVGGMGRGGRRLIEARDRWALSRAWMPAVAVGLDA